MSRKGLPCPSRVRSKRQRLGVPEDNIWYHTGISLFGIYHGNNTMHTNISTQNCSASNSIQFNTDTCKRQLIKYRVGAHDEQIKCPVGVRKKSGFSIQLNVECRMSNISDILQFQRHQRYNDLNLVIILYQVTCFASKSAIILIAEKKQLHS